MPYLKREERESITDGYGCIEPYSIQTPGGLNYAITELIVAYIANRKLNYQSINDVVGALTCAKDEFQRRIVGPYEDTKIIANGDVYPSLDIMLLDK